MCGQKYTSVTERFARLCVLMWHKPCLQGRQGDARLDSVMQQCATRHVFPSLSFFFSITVIQRSLTCQRPDALAGVLLPFWFSVKQDQIRKEERGRDESMSQPEKPVFMLNEIYFLLLTQASADLYLCFLCNAVCHLLQRSQ